MKRTFLMPFLMLAIATAGCNEAPDELLILCGDSFQTPMEKIEKMYEEETGEAVTLSLGGSEDHLPNVQNHSVGDIYVSHDPFMKNTEDAGALSRCAFVGHLVPVLVVKKGNPRGIEKIEDLAQDDLRVILTNPEYSDAGMMIFALLKKKGILDKVEKNVGNALVRKHSIVATQIKMGHRDAGVMWKGVAMQEDFADDIEIVPTPYEYDRNIRVGVMGLSYSKQPEKVERFLKFIEKHGEAVFKESNYTK